MECRRAFDAERTREFFRSYREAHGIGYLQERYPENRREQVKRYWQKHPEARRASDSRRRALEKGATVESFTHLEVFERDRWICGICKRRVDSSLTWPHPKSPSLDHIIPLSQGGEHSRANTRLAHVQCNIRRGNRGGNDQLAVI